MSQLKAFLEYAGLSGGSFKSVSYGSLAPVHVSQEGPWYSWGTPGGHVIKGYPTCVMMRCDIDAFADLSHII